MCRYAARRFHGVRLARGTLPVLPADRPVIVYSNHPSWWDPAMFIMLATLRFPERNGYGPMEASALEQYRFMRRIGIFGIETDSPRGAAAFLKISSGLLEDPQHHAVDHGGRHLHRCPHAGPSGCVPASPIWRAGCRGRSSCRWPWNTRSGTSARRKRCAASARRWKAAAAPWRSGTGGLRRR